MKIPKAFTLIELILVVGIVAILAATMIPFITSARLEARVAKALKTSDALRIANQLHHADTGQYANEFSWSNLAAHHGLATDAGLPGWDGPYLPERVSAKDNPFGDLVTLHSTCNVDFDFDGDGLVDRVNGSSCSEIVFFSTPLEAGILADEAIDAGVPGNPWLNGRVQYNAVQFRVFLSGE